MDRLCAGEVSSTCITLIFLVGERPFSASEGQQAHNISTLADLQNDRRKNSYGHPGPSPGLATSAVEGRIQTPASEAIVPSLLGQGSPIPDRSM